MTDRSRAPRNPPLEAKGLLFAGTILSVSGGTLVVAWLSFAEGQLYVAHGSSIIVAWGCEPPAHMLGASMCRRARQALVAGRTPRQSSFRTELPALQSVPLLASHAGPPCSLSLCPSLLSIHLVPRPAWLDTPLGSSIVVHHLHPRVSADLKHFSTLYGAGVDEDDLPCRGFAKAEALIDKPFVDDHLHDLRLVCQSLLQSCLTLRLALFVPFFLHPGDSPGCNLRFRLGAPFSADQDSNQLL